MNPLRYFRTTFFKLTALYALVFGISSLIIFGLVFWMANATLEKQMNQSIKGEFSTLEQEYRIGHEKELIREIRQRITSGEHGFSYYLFQNSKGQKLAGNLPTMSQFEGWREISVPYPSVIKENDPDSTEAQSSVAWVMGRQLKEGAFLVVGTSTYRNEEFKEAFRDAFFWAVSVIFIFSFVGGTILSSGFLRRVDVINRTVKEIINGHLSERVRTLGTKDELDLLAENLNTMLDHIQALMDSLQQISTSIAHDLRRPLGRLRQNLEAVCQDNLPAGEYKAAVDSALQETDDILATFSSLIRIAQIESKTRRFLFEKVNLSAVYQTVADVYAPVIDDVHKMFEVDIEPGLEIDGDRELLTQQVANLLENAISHTPEKAHIRLKLSHGRKGPVGILSDNGPGIDKQEREKIFERFYRLEASRTSPGNGLGLALAKAVADLHEAEITVSDNQPGAIFKICYKEHIE